MKRSYYLPSILLILLLIIVVYSITSQSKIPQVTSTFPKNQAIKVLDNQPITVSFAQDLSNNQIEMISIKTSPNHPVAITWPTAKTLQISPQDSWTPSQLFTFNIFYGQKPIHSLDFTTNAYSTVELQQQIKTQIEDDYIYGMTRAITKQKLPWLDKLPIEEELFTLDYSEQDKVFRIIVANNHSPAEIDAMKTAAIKTLAELGVEPDIITFEVVDIRPLL